MVCWILACPPSANSGTANDLSGPTGHLGCKPMPRLTDRDQIRAILATDRPWAAYALGDLEPEPFPHTTWFGPPDGTPALALLYREFAVPVLLTVGEAGRLRPVLDEVAAELGSASAMDLSVRPDVFALLGQRYRIAPEHAMHRMLLDPNHYHPASTEEVNRLGPADLPAVQRLHADGEAADEVPHFFVPVMLERGVYYGVREGDELIAAAGTHMISTAEGVGCIGNIYTRRDRRGRGWGARVTSAVTTRLLGLNLRTVVLNVRTDNLPAVHLYEKLRFQRYCGYYEAVAHLPGGGPTT